MKEKTRELVTVNFILFSILVLLATFSLGRQADINVFAGNLKPVYKIETEEKVVGFMCNVYWGTEYIVPYLELFAQYDIKVTFFIGGTWAVDNPELVQQIFDNGHEVASHGYSHKLASKNSAQVMEQEIIKTDEILKQICGKKPVLYAPPSGDFNDKLLSSAQSQGYKTIMWSIDTIDWRDHDTAKITRRIKDNMKPGAFVLMHPTANTLESLKTVVPDLLKDGYQFCTISEMLEK